jgi:hypothetical protein
MHPLTLFAGLAVVAVLWGLLGAVGVRCQKHRLGVAMGEEVTGADGDGLFLTVLLAPMKAPMEVGLWLLWRFSDEGQHELKRRQLERQRELEDRYDEMMEDL